MRDTKWTNVLATFKQVSIKILASAKQIVNMTEASVNVIEYQQTLNLFYPGS